MKAVDLFDRAWLMFAPLSRATTPLRIGLARKRLQQAGVQLRDVVIGGTRLNYYLQRPQNAPNNPPLLFVHGLGDSAMTWSQLFPLLPQHTIYAIDLPGYGFSELPAGVAYISIAAMRDMLAAFAREVIGQPALVVGNSLGGWLAIELARSAPELVRELVLLNPGGALLGGETSYTEFRDLLGAGDLQSARTVLRRMFGAVPRPLLYLSQSAISEVFGRRVVREFINTVSEDEFLGAEDLHELRVPTALVWGERDAFLPEGSFAFFRDNLPNVALHVLPGVGHIPQAERPREVAQIIERISAKN